MVIFCIFGWIGAGDIGCGSIGRYVVIVAAGANQAAQQKRKYQCMQLHILQSSGTIILKKTDHRHGP